MAWKFFDGAFQEVDAENAVYAVELVWDDKGDIENSRFFVVADNVTKKGQSYHFESDIVKTRVES